jgi:hypothetical protein
VDVVRRTVNLPDAIDEQVREAAEEGESYSAAVARLLELGVKASGRKRRPAWVGSGDGPTDLGRRAEEYLRKPVKVT